MVHSEELQQNSVAELNIITVSWFLFVCFDCVFQRKPPYWKESLYIFIILYSDLPVLVIYFQVYSCSQIHNQEYNRTEDDGIATVDEQT